MTNDGAHAYVYNAESETTTAGTRTYLYDGDGKRVEKNSPYIYWYGAGSAVLDESNSGTIAVELVYFGGRVVANRVTSSGNIFYYEEDLLGSSRTMVQAGLTAVCYDADFEPFGGERAIVNTCSQNYKFEGKKRDPETRNDDFGARFYRSNLGRWMSADWSSVPAPVPYANLTNPQTLNLYAMVSDNPETFADLDGHTCGTIGSSDRNGCSTVANSKVPHTGGKDPDSHKNGAGTPDSAQDQAQHAQQQNQNQQQTDNKESKAPILPPQANPSAQAEKNATRKFRPEGPAPPKETPNPTEPARPIVPGADKPGVPIDTTPGTKIEPNPEYMTTGQKVIYTIMNGVRVIFGGGKPFVPIIVVPKVIPKAWQDPFNAEG